MGPTWRKCTCSFEKGTQQAVPEMWGSETIDNLELVFCLAMSQVRITNSQHGQQVLRRLHFLESNNMQYCNVLNEPDRLAICCQLLGYIHAAIGINSVILLFVSLSATSWRCGLVKYSCPEQLSWSKVFTFIRDNRESWHLDDIFIQYKKQKLMWKRILGSMTRISLLVICSLFGLKFVLFLCLWMSFCKQPVRPLI